MSAVSLIHHRPHTHRIVRRHAVADAHRRHFEPNLMYVVIATVLVVVGVISQIPPLGWFGAALAFVVTLAATSTVIGTIFHLLDEPPEAER